MPNDLPAPAKIATSELTAHLVSAIRANAEVIVVLHPTADQLEKFFAPRWMPLPSRGQTCRVTGLPSSTLKDYIIQSRNSDQPIKTRHLKQQGRTKGVRMVHLPTLLAWLESQPPWEEMAPSPAPPSERA